MFSSRELVLLLVLLGAITVLGAGTVQPQPEEPAVRRLLSADAETRQEAKREILEARTKLIADLLKMIGDEDNRLKRHDSVSKAMYILGEMRATEAIETLVSNITHPIDNPPGEPRPSIHPKIVSRDARPLSAWPAVMALVKIGEPSVQPALNRLRNYLSTNEKSACVLVLEGVRGRESAATILKDAIAKETDPQRRSRLENGLNLLLKLD
jgi:hypothetical protein